MDGLENGHLALSSSTSIIWFIFYVLFCKIVEWKGFLRLSLTLSLSPLIYLNIKSKSESVLWKPKAQPFTPFLFPLLPTAIMNNTHYWLPFLKVICYEGRSIYVSVSLSSMLSICKSKHALKYTNLY